MLEILTSNYATTLLPLLADVSSSVDVLSYVSNFNIYKRSDLANLIFRALQKTGSRGCPVRIILDYPRPHRPNYNCNKFSTRRFLESGFKVRFLHSGSTQHAKLFLLDKTLVITGSHNLTTRSVTNPYDISILLDEPRLVYYLQAYFEDVWLKSVSP